MCTTAIACRGCNKIVKRPSKSGYCAVCFHANVDNIKSLYNAERWKDGHAKRSHWKSRGAVISEEDIRRHEATSECDFCGCDVSSSKQLDHCHDTGKYRGTLCKECNTGLGKLGDNLDVIAERLLQYKLKQTGQ